MPSNLRWRLWRKSWHPSFPGPVFALPISLFPLLKPPSLSSGSLVMSNVLIQNTALCVHMFQLDGPQREGRRRHPGESLFQSSALCFSLFCTQCLIIKYFGSTCKDSIFFPSLLIYFCRVHDWRSNSFGALRSCCRQTSNKSEIHL